MGKLKKIFFAEIKKDEIKKQFTKYSKILRLLSSEPNLSELKKRIGLNADNNLLFFVVTDGNYFNFEYMRHIKKKFKEDIHSDKDSDKLPNYFKIFDLISSIIPVMLIFVPRTLDDNLGTFSSKSEQKIIENLQKEIQTLKDNQENMKSTHQKEIDQMKNNLKEMREKIVELLGKKKLRKKVHEENEEMKAKRKV